MSRVTYSLKPKYNFDTYDISLKLYRTLIKLVHIAVYCITEGVVIALQSCWIVLRKLHTCSSAAHFFNQWFNKPYSKAESFYDKWSQHLCYVLVSDFQFGKEMYNVKVLTH